jgi:hypothetical protein
MKEHPELVAICIVLAMISFLAGCYLAELCLIWRGLR